MIATSSRVMAVEILETGRIQAILHIECTVLEDGFYMVTRENVLTNGCQALGMNHRWIELPFYRNGEMEKPKKNFKWRWRYLIQTNTWDIYMISCLVFQVGSWLSIMVFCQSLEIWQVSCFIDDTHFIFGI